MSLRPAARAALATERMRATFEAKVVTATRFGEDKGAIALSFVNLPTGVTAPEGSVIPEGQKEVEVDLSAAADAAVGRIENLAVNGSARVKETDVSVQSAPTPFEVVAQ